MLSAVLSPQQAVATIVATGIVVDVLVLIADGSRPQSSARDVLSLAAWSPPGLGLGAVLLRILPVASLQLLVAAAVLLAVWHRRRRLAAIISAALSLFAFAFLVVGL
ncbi:MAG: hypothetical protein H0V22_04050 [Solirubrobacterales bacterium]|nr:hypothetical protein [Solirubrobacterales bacterium]